MACKIADGDSRAYFRAVEDANVIDGEFTVVNEAPVNSSRWLLEPPQSPPVLPSNPEQ